MADLEITNNKWYSILDQKLKMLAEIQNKTFDMIEKYNIENNKAHQEIMDKINALH